MHKKFLKIGVLSFIFLNGMYAALPNKKKNSATDASVKEDIQKFKDLYKPPFDPKWIAAELLIAFGAYLNQAQPHARL